MLFSICSYSSFPNFFAIAHFAIIPLYQSGKIFSYQGIILVNDQNKTKTKMFLVCSFVFKIQNLNLLKLVTCPMFSKIFFFGVPHLATFIFKFSF